MRSTMAGVATLLLIGVHGGAQATPRTGRHVHDPLPRRFDHVVIVVLENTGYHEALGDPDLQALRKQGAWLTEYHAITHPSFPNYLALIAGETHGVRSDDQPNPGFDIPTIADALERRGLTWKGYAEDYPGSATHCFLGATAGTLYIAPPGSRSERPGRQPYARKHVPFLSIARIQRTPLECRNVVDARAFWDDLRRNALPNYAFYTPNMSNDGHDTSLRTAARWLRAFLARVRAHPGALDRTLLVVTFDEGEDQDAASNHIATILLGAGVVPGDHPGYASHYSLLRTIEDNFALSPVGPGDRAASAIDVWERHR